MTSQTIDKAERFMFQTYRRAPLTLVRGDGCRVWDEQDKEYLDFVGGIAVCALGHSSPVISAAICEQSKKLVHVSNLYYTQPQTELAQLLIENSFADRVFFSNSGAEANEAAIKLARRYSKDHYGPNRHVILTMENSFHGRTIPFNDLQALKASVDESVCAVLVEPIQGEGGIVVPDSGYLRGVRQICDAHNLLLIVDEIQVGMGRTGKLFAYQHFGITPDIMTLAKALGNGLPIGAMLAKEHLKDSLGAGTHATTFGGSPLISSGALALVKSLLNDRWVEHARDLGNYFKKGLLDLQRKYSCIQEVRGLGLILGLLVDGDGSEIVNACMDRGFLINCIQERILRFVPPLIVSENEIDRMLNCLDEVFAEP
jgi:acetylornithine/N-succinyldiaminopimelate aminotransferase